MIIPTLATFRMYHLLEKLKKHQDEEDGLFLSKSVDEIINDFEKLKELEPKLEMLYREILKEEEDIFEKPIR